MSFSDNIEYLMAHPGTVAVLTWDNKDMQSGGLESWNPTLNNALSMMDNSGESAVSAVIGEHSILAETRDGQQCAVVYPTGHPVSKVMRRMLRKAAGPKRTMRKVEAKPVATPSE